MSKNEKTLSELGFVSSKKFSGTLSGICSDSRFVKPRELFAALPGKKEHGANFIPQAVDLGAAAVLTDQMGLEIARTLNTHQKVAFLISEKPRAALATAAASWFEKQPQNIVAVTGTNGKTSVASFCRQIWSGLGFKAVNLGTTGVEGAVSATLENTTPDPITLHRVLSECYQNGVTHVAMEASSHGLEQFRLDAVKLCAAGFTNFTHDHLDYHTSFEQYFESKAGLFNRVLSWDGVSVLDLDNQRIAALFRKLTDSGRPTFSVGWNRASNLRLVSQKYDVIGQTLRFSYQGKTIQSFLPLIGNFQGKNAIMAAALCIASGCDAQHVFGILKELKTVRGRMQHAATRTNGATIFVDYAHTPDALETALNAFRPHVLGRLITIIGAGGDRDPKKRPMMGAVAANTADYVIVTDDNPRSEEPEAIRRMVLDGAKGNTNIIECSDRAEAILRGVDMLEAGDSLLITGKGHETTQIIGEDILPFDDVEQASISVVALDGVI